ncbi:MAG: hypothetical protein LUE88_02845 [Clostridiales bacterium]|nr:hypothetical protein [Clostridiales bacterium]
MKFKKGLAAALISVMALSGCGSTESTAEINLDEMSADELITLANDTMAGIDSMSASIGMEMSADIDEEAFDMAMIADMDIIYEEPIRLKMDMNVLTDGESAGGYSIYAVQDGDTMNMYINLGDDTWYSQQSTVENMAQYNAQTTAEQYLNNISSFAEDGTETINGVDTKIISGVFTGDSIKEVIANSGMESFTGSLEDMTEEEFDEIINAVGDIPIRLWISGEGYVMKYELDMTEMAQALMVSIIAQSAGLSEEDVPMTVSEMIISMTCDNYNAVEEFEIPEAALAE